MNMVYQIKRNDTWPPLEAHLYHGGGTPINLTGATIHLVAKSMTTDRSLRKPVTILDATNGLVRCWLSNTDTAIAEKYRGEFEIVFAGGETSTVPNDSHFTIHIYEDL